MKYSIVIPLTPESTLLVNNEMYLAHVEKITVNNALEKQGNLEKLIIHLIY